MKYMLLIWNNPENWDALPAAEQAAVSAVGMTEHLAIDADLIASGELVVSAGLADPVTTRTVRVRDGVIVSTDGPFAEAKEHLVGYYLVDCETLERATEVAARIPDARWQRVEIRAALDVAGLEM